MKKSVFYFLFISSLLIGCEWEDLDNPGYRKGSEINIYLVKNGQIDRSSTKPNLNELELERIPWISQHEMYFYDWSAHIFYLKEEKLREDYSGRYFLVKANDEPLFLGYFFPPYMSSFPPYPSVMATDYDFYPLDVVSIGGFGGYFDETMDENLKFKNALINSELYREGIFVELTGVKKKNATTVDYSFRVTNREKEYIYILDPAEMGPDNFHYYTNGVSFVKGSTYYFSENMHTPSSESIPLKWYYRLPGGKSITRTVELDGFKSLPAGTCTCTFSLPGAKLKSGEWRLRDGRIWLGDFYIKKVLNL